MQIVFTREVADLLREKYTLLQLDTVTVEGHGDVETFCVLEPENIVHEMSQLGDRASMHARLIERMAADDCVSAKGLCEQLKGSFGGELDTFYDIVLERIKTAGTTRLYSNNPA